MAISESVLTDLAQTPYAEIRDAVQDGDILLCSAHDFFSRLIRWATKSPWSHCAIAFRMEEIDRVLVLEAVEKLGVRCVPLSAFLKRTSSGLEPYPGDIVLARHKGLAAKSRARPMKKMADFAFDRLGDKFSHREMFKIILRIALGRINRHMPKILVSDDEFICSEYVARCYETLGITIPWDGLGFMAPADIARDPGLQAVARIRT